AQSDRPWTERGRFPTRTHATTARSAGSATPTSTSSAKRSTSPGSVLIFALVRRARQQTRTDRRMCRPRAGPNTSPGSQNPKLAHDPLVHQRIGTPWRGMTSERQAGTGDGTDRAAAAFAAGSLPDVAMSDALTSTWKAIRRRHPKVPEATVSVAPGRGTA